MHDDPVPTQPQSPRLRTLDEFPDREPERGGIDPEHLRLGGEEESDAERGKRGGERGGEGVSGGEEGEVVVERVAGGDGEGTALADAAAEALAEPFGFVDERFGTDEDASEER